jgi:hypothetical protein
MKANKRTIVDEIYDRSRYNSSLGNGIKLTEEQAKAFGLKINPEVKREKRNTHGANAPRREQNSEAVGGMPTNDSQSDKVGLVEGSGSDNTKTV